MDTFYKRLLIGLFLVLLLGPAFQARLHYVAEPPLQGAFTTAPRPNFTWAGLLNNTYQPALAQYAEDGIGFRALLIRLRNQLLFSCFGVPGNSNVTVGLHNVLFEPIHIAAYAGQDLLPEAEVRYQVRQLRTVQRDLSRRGVQLLFVLAPNKARFEPENLPAALRPAPGTVTNYDLYARALQADTVTWLDMVPLFAKWKKTVPYPLFPRGGTHWSGYGATLAGDTILRRLEQLGGVHLPTVRTVGPPRIVRTTDSLHATDNDLSKPLNLLRQAEAAPMAYRQLAFDAPRPAQTRPPALFVADSFIWGLAHFGPYLQNEFADDSRVWYYGNEVFKPDNAYQRVGEVASLDLRHEVESRRFIVVLLTEHNLPKREFGFTNHVYRLYHPLAAADQAAIDQLTARLIAEDAAQHPNAVWTTQAQDNTNYTARMRAQAEATYEQQLRQ